MIFYQITNYQLCTYQASLNKVSWSKEDLIKAEIYGMYRLKAFVCFTKKLLQRTSDILCFSGHLPNSLLETSNLMLYRSRTAFAMKNYTPLLQRAPISNILDS